MEYPPIPIDLATLLLVVYLYQITLLQEINDYVTTNNSENGEKLHKISQYEKVCST